MGQNLMNWEIRPQKTKSFARAGISHSEAQWRFDVVDEKFVQFFAENLFLQQKPRWAGQVREGKMVAGGWMDGIKKEEHRWN